MDDSTISSNGTGNLRYFGSGTNADDVPNYISFNNELWRIIGVFNVYNADTGATEKTVKIIRNESLGKYSWDTSTSNINGGYGVNAWNDATLMKRLNNDYLESGINSSKITEECQQYIMKARWYLGGWNSTSVSAANMYKYEIKDYIDNLIGLAYPSDFGFAAKNNGTSNCYENMSTTANCSSTYNWMSKGQYEWTITPYVGSSCTNYVFGWYSSGFLDCSNAYINYGVHSVLYLSSDDLIVSGEGTSKNPYKLL